MKSFFLTLAVNVFLLLPAVSFFSCGSGKNDPVDAAKAFMSAVEKFDFKKARELVTSEYGASLDRIEKFAASMSEEEKQKKMEEASGYKFDYTLVEKTDSSAIVAIKAQTDIRDIHVQFYLKKRKNKWLVDSQEDE